MSTLSSFKADYRVSWVDTDAANVVHYSNYFRFFERTEEEFYTSLGLNFTEVRKKYGVWLPRAEAFCRYKSPSGFNDLLEITLSVSEVRDKSVKYTFTVSNKDTSKLVAEGYVVIVTADLTTGRAVSIPEEFASTLKSFLPE